MPAICRLSLLAFLTVLLASCSSGSQRELSALESGLQGRGPGKSRPLSPESAGLPALPSPSQLAPHAASLGGPANDWRAEGSEFLPEYPFAHLAASGTGSSGELSPAQASGGPLSDMAYGIYCLDTPDYAGPHVYFLDWDTPPAPGTAFMAIANFALNRWEWFSVPAGNSVSPPADFGAAYRNANNNTFIALVLGGSAPAALDYVRLGDNLPPVPALSADPLSGATSDTYTLDASASFDQDGEIVDYMFSAGDQVFNNGPDPVLSNLTFSEPGDQFCVVTVTDDDGQQEQANVTIPVVAGPLAVLNANKVRLDYGGLLDFDGSLSEAGEGTITKYEFDPEGDGSFMDNGTDATLENHLYSASGVFNAALRITNSNNDMHTGYQVIRVDWRHTYNAGGYAGIYELRALPDGSCLVCGTIDSDALVMRLSASGELIWKRRLRNDSAASLDDFSGMALGGNGYVYVAGRQHYDDMGNEKRYLKLLQIDISDAGLGFERVVDFGIEQPNTGDLDLLVDSQGSLHLLGRVNDGTRTDIYALRFDDDGLFEQGVRWDDDGSTVSRSFGGAAIDAQDNIYINTYSELESPDHDRIHLLSLDRNLTQRWSRPLEVVHGGETASVRGEGVCLSGGALFVTASLNIDGELYGGLFKLGTDGAALLHNAVPHLEGFSQLELGHCSTDNLGGIYCGGVGADPQGGSDALLMRFNSSGALTLSRHYGLDVNSDDAQNCGPFVGSEGQVYFGGYVQQHVSVFNDYVYTPLSLDSVDWQTPALPQDLDSLVLSTSVINSAYEDFTFADVDTGGGFVMRYHP